jgi:hypothetical protein
MTYYFVPSWVRTIDAIVSATHIYLQDSAKSRRLYRIWMLGDLNRHLFHLPHHPFMLELPLILLAMSGQLRNRYPGI